MSSSQPPGTMNLWRAEATRKQNVRKLLSICDHLEQDVPDWPRKTVKLDHQAWRQRVYEQKQARRPRLKHMMKLQGGMYRFPNREASLLEAIFRTYLTVYEVQSVLTVSRQFCLVGQLCMTHAVVQSYGTKLCLKYARQYPPVNSRQVAFPIVNIEPPRKQLMFTPWKWSPHPPLGYLTFSAACRVVRERCFLCLSKHVSDLYFHERYPYPRHRCVYAPAKPIVLAQRFCETCRFRYYVRWYQVFVHAMPPSVYTNSWQRRFLQRQMEAHFRHLGLPVHYFECALRQARPQPRKNKKQRIEA